MPRLAIAALLSLLAVACASAPRQSDFRSITFSLLEDYDKGSDLGSVARDFEVMTSLGIDTWRGSFGWDDYEPEEGRYDFEWLHAFASLAAQHRIQLRPYIAYTPEWAARGGTDENAWNDPPRTLASWRAFVSKLSAALARHANILSYEIYNEQNTRMWWEGDVADYIEVLDAASAEIRRNDRDAAVIMGGLVWPDAEWLREVCESNADDFDVAAFHAYPETWTEDGVAVENYLGPNYADFLETAQRDCGGKPVSINETGFATTPGKSEREQANWWARAIATFAATPGVTHIGIYEVNDLSTGQPVIGDAPNYYLGILRQDRTPKLAFHTLRMLIPLMTRQPFATRPDAVTVTGAPVHYQVFERADGSQLLFVWREPGTGSATVDVTLRGTASSATEYRIDGTSAAVSRFDGKAIRGVVVGGDVVMYEFRRTRHNQ